MDRPQLSSLIHAKYTRYAHRVVWRIKRLPKECLQSGDDSPMRNVWEEWVVQTQGEQSFFYEAYEDTIRDVCRELARSLPEEEQGLLWLWTDAYYDWNEERDGTEIPYGASVLDALERELFRYVCVAAENVELPQRLVRYIEGW